MVPGARSSFGGATGPSGSGISRGRRTSSGAGVGSRANSRNVGPATGVRGVDLPDVEHLIGVLADLKASNAEQHTMHRRQIRSLGKQVEELGKNLETSSVVPRVLGSELGKIRRPTGVTTGNVALLLRNLIAQQNLRNSASRDAGRDAPRLVQFLDTTADSAVNQEFKVSWEKSLHGVAAACASLLFSGQ